MNRSHLEIHKTKQKKSEVVPNISGMQAKIKVTFQNSHTYATKQTNARIQKHRDDVPHVGITTHLLSNTQTHFFG